MGTETKPTSNAASEKSKKNAAVMTVGLVMAIMLLGKMTGLIRESFTQAFLGTESVEAKAFVYASAIPRDFLDFAFASAISSCFIPVFNAYLQKKGKPAAFRLADNFITLILLLSALVTALAFLFAPQVVAVMGGQLPEGTRAVAAALLKVLLPTILFSAVAFSVTGVLQSLGEFRIPAAMSVVSNLLIIAYFLFFFDRFGVFGLAAVFLLGWGTQLLIQVPPLYKKGYRYRPYLNLSDSGLKEIAVLVVPVMLSAWVQPVSHVINMNAVSGLVQGGGTTLNAANQLYAVITGVLILSIANVIFPKLSRDAAQKDDEAFGGTLRQTIRVLFFLLLPMTLGLMLLSKPIVAVAFERKLFDAASTASAASALVCYAVGMVGFGLQTILSRGFYADKNSKVPLYTGIAAIAINAALSFSLVGLMGVGGPALATSVAMTVTSTVMLYCMYRKNNSILDRKAVTDIFKMLAAALSMAGVVFAAARGVDFLMPADGFVKNLVQLAVAVGAGGCWYLLVAFLAKIEEAAFLFTALATIRKR